MTDDTNRRCPGCREAVDASQPALRDNAQRHWHKTCAQTLLGLWGSLHIPAWGHAGPMPPEELRQLQARIGWSNHITAERLGVSRATVEKWRSGQNRITGPTALLIRILAGRQPGQPPEAKP